MNKNLPHCLIFTNANLLPNVRETCSKKQENEQVPGKMIQKMPFLTGYTGRLNYLMMSKHTSFGQDKTFQKMVQNSISQNWYEKKRRWNRLRNWRFSFRKKMWRKKTDHWAGEFAFVYNFRTGNNRLRNWRFSFSKKLRWKLWYFRNEQPGHRIQFLRHTDSRNQATNQSNMKSGKLYQLRLNKSNRAKGFLKVYKSRKLLNCFQVKLNFGCFES